MKAKSVNKNIVSLILLKILPYLLVAILQEQSQPRKKHILWISQEEVTERHVVI